MPVKPSMVGWLAGFCSGVVQRRHAAALKNPRFGVSRSIPELALHPKFRCILAG
jgi:hypothetical protein